MGGRFEKRKTYMDGWYRLDAGLLLGSTTTDFVFDDPLEPGPVSRDRLEDYMQRWYAWTRKMGGDNRWRLCNTLREDRDGILTEWEWWEMPGTPLSGAALVLTRDQGVFLERITYFNREALPPR